MTWVVRTVTNDTVYLDAYYDQFDDAASLFGMNLKGKLVSHENEPVTVRGNHVVIVKWVSVDD